MAQVAHVSQRREWSVGLVIREALRAYMKAEREEELRDTAGVDRKSATGVRVSGAARRRA
jgi:hypothetical protein